GLWLTLVLTVSIFYNTIFKSSGLVAFSTIATIILISVGSSLFGEKLSYSPSNISNHSFEFLHTGEISSSLIVSAVTTVIACLILLLLSIYIFRTKEHAG